MDMPGKKGGGKGATLLIGIGPSEKRMGKGRMSEDDSGEYETDDGDEEMRDVKLAAADALKAALKDGDSEALVDALDAFMDCR